MATRLALHTGEAQLRDGDYYGGTLNRAARIRALAAGGEILCSRATADLIADTLPPDIRLSELGTHELKGLRRSETVHALVGIDETSPPRLRQSSPTHNLPQELTSFIGRHRELAELRALVADSRLVTLSVPEAAARRGSRAGSAPSCRTGRATAYGWSSLRRSAIPPVSRRRSRRCSASLTSRGGLRSRGSSTRCAIERC